jgi:DNA invertase Pin-like site-specific DNA recombinase
MTVMTSISSGVSTKIQGQHRDRLAVVYVRQATPQQLVRHQESTRLQYGLVERALAFGWAQPRVLVIDEDWGKSADQAQGRPGFQRLVAEVSLAHVGIVFGLDISRLARSSRDWHHVLEVCALFGTLIGDLDGVYDPMDYNDRLLLGLKGTMFEAEGHVLKQRLLAGKRAKAQRGELGMQVPMGYLRRPAGDVVKDPDAQAQAVIQLVFDQFTRQTTVGGVLRYLVQHGIALPYRSASGATKGDLEWRRPTWSTLKNIVRHPMYAGAYVYGRRPTDPRRKQPGRPATGKRVAPRHEWQVLRHDHYPAYISWEQFERNQRQLAANCNATQGAIRRGPSLLAGLVVCGRCGVRMSAVYTNNGTGLRYFCGQAKTHYGAPHCQSLVGPALDTLVSTLVLQALEPAALEVSLQVAADVEAERQQLHQQWTSRLERARYEVERIVRQYNAVEPEHRLVARTLERQWESALAAEETLTADYHRFLAAQPVTLSATERGAIRRLASDIPALWRAHTTTQTERQAIIRLLVHRVVVTVQGESEHVAVRVDWVGGHGTEATLIRPVARLEQLSYYPQLQARVVALYTQGEDRTTIAQILNAEGWRPAKRRTTFTALMVGRLLAREGLRSLAPARALPLVRAADEWTLQALAQTVGIPQETLYAWLRRGRLTARRDTSASPPRWIIHADATELERLRAIRNAPHTWQRSVATQKSVKDF